MSIGSRRTSLFYVTSMLSLALATESVEAHRGDQVDVGPPAQDRSASPSDTDEPNSSGETANVDGDPIIVTGTRIRRDGFESPTPVTVINSSDIQARNATNFADVLNELPAFGFGNTPAGSGLATIVAGTNSPNLRNLGLNRQLVLVDGRRFVSGSTVNSAVDLNAIPSLAIERIDVVTGGASAVYGSDAISGVVNVILKDKFDGLELSAEGGISDEGDAFRQRYGLIAGRGLLDNRLHVSVAAEYEDVEGFAQSARSFSSQGTSLVPNPLDTGPNDGIPAQVVADGVTIPSITQGGVPLTFAGGGLFLLDPDTGVPLQFASGGTLVPFNPGGVLDPITSIGGEGVATNFEPILPLSGPLERLSISGKIAAEITDAVEFFTDLTFARTDSNVEQLPTFDSLLNPTPVFADNAFLSPEAAGLIAGQGGFVFLGRANEDFGATLNVSTRETFSVAFGVRGTFAKNGRWSVHYQYGETNVNTVLQNDRVTSDFGLALDSVIDPATGSPICRIALSDPTTDCVPVDVFGVGAPSQEALDFFQVDTLLSDASIRQQVIVGDISSDLVDLPAGPLTVAAGFEYRTEDLENVVDPLFEAGATSAGQLQGVSGDFRVYEVFGEVVVPIAKDQPLLRNLEFNAAGRFADYDTIGGTFTWKAGLSYNPFEDFRLRGTVSRDIRAPGIFDLFQASGGSFDVAQDPCDSSVQLSNPVVAANCASIGLPGDFTQLSIAVPVNNIGNPDLQEERATTFTVGAVWSPDYIDGLNVSVDWYNIRITDAINRFQPQIVFDRCFGDTDFPAPSFCDLILRDPVSGQIDQFISQPLNLASFETNGVDLTASYRTELSRFGLPDDSGTILLQFNGTFLGELAFSETGLLEDTVEQAGQLEQGIEYKWNASAQFTKGDFSLFAQVRFVGSSNFDNSLTTEDQDLLGVGSETYLNVSASIEVDEITLFAGIDNVFDNDPPFVPGAVIFSEPAIFDVRGRFFSFGLRAKF